MNFERVVRGFVISAVVFVLLVVVFLKEDFRQAYVNVQASNLNENYILEAERNRYLELLMASGDSRLVEFAKNWKNEAKGMSEEYSRDVLKAFVQKNLPGAIIQENEIGAENGAKK